MAKAKKKKTNTGARAAAAGLGIAAAGLAVYLLTGERGKKNRAKVKKWSEKFQKDVIKEVKQLATITKKDYEAIIERVADTYSDIDTDELRRLMKEARTHFADVKKMVGPAVKKNAKKAKKKTKKAVRAAKKTAKKTAKKATSKKKMRKTAKKKK